MNKAKISITLIAATLLLGFFPPGYLQFDRKFGDGIECGDSNALAAPINSEPISKWQSVEDLQFGFTVEYPSSWEMNINIEQPSPYIYPDAILKRYTFLGSEGLVDLDILFSNGKAIDRWLEWYSETINQLPFTGTNAKVAGRPAVMFLEDSETVDLISSFWSNEKFIFRLMYTVTRNEVGMQVYRHMLDTIGSPETKTIVAAFRGDALKNGHEFGYESDLMHQMPAEIPETLIVGAQSIIENSKLINPLVSNCCGYSSPANPFPCCVHGNCTWWVYRSYGYVPFTGDAYKWWGQVPLYADWSRGSQPRWNAYTGENIAWWSKTAKPPWGHVAYVPNYTGGSKIYGTEMFCGSDSCATSFSYNVSSPGGYIFRVNGPYGVEVEQP